MANEQLKQEVISTLINIKLPKQIGEYPEGHYLMDCSGELLYSGWSAFKSAPVYVMGLNPGGRPNKEEDKPLRQAIEDAKLDRPYSAYVHDQWEWRGNKQKTGEHPHQRRVVDYLKSLGLENTSEVPSCNAVFVRTHDAYGINGLNRLFNACLAVHRRLLREIRPKLILCLGNGEAKSPYSLLRDKFLIGQAQNANTKVNGKLDSRYKYFHTTLGNLLEPQCDTQDQEVCVFGVPHPSRFKPTKVVKDELLNVAMGLGILNKGQQ